MEIYTERIGLAESMEDLENIVEDAADDMGITNVDYCRVYNMCVNKAREL